MKFKIHTSVIMKMKMIMTMMMRTMSFSRFKSLPLL